MVDLPALPNDVMCVSGKKKIIILFHDLSSGPFIWRGFNELVQEHYDIVCPLLVGHMHSDFNVLNSTTCQRWIQQAIARYDTVIQSGAYAACDITVGGVGMGAALATIVAANREVGELLMVQPTFRIRDLKYRIAMKLSAIIEKMNAPKELMDHVINTPFLRHDERKLLVDYYARYIPLKATIERSIVQKIAFNNIHRIGYSHFVIVMDKFDRFSRRVAIQDIAHRILSDERDNGQIHIHVLNRSNHNLLNESDSTTIAKLFLGNHKLL